MEVDTFDELDTFNLVEQAANYIYQFDGPVKLTNPNFIELFQKLHIICDTLAAIVNQNNEILEIDLPLINHCLKKLRKSCTYGEPIQTGIARRQDFFPLIRKIMAIDESRKEYQPAHSEMITVCWQLLCNICVGNLTTQQLIWQHLNSMFCEYLTSNHKSNDLCRMIIYNIWISGNIDDEWVFQSLVQNLSREVECKSNTLPEFLQFHLEHFITEQRHFVPKYAKLEVNHRIPLLYFIADYIRTDNNKIISSDLIKYLCKEFKKKSDCILKTVTSYVNDLNPSEVNALVDVITCASGKDAYIAELGKDGSLFLNVGCLLQTINSIGKSSENMFTPVRQLSECVPTERKTNIEEDVSFELKTKLVRTLANLSYRNRHNQDLAKELSIMMAVLDCANMDARNPLIREWAVVAIRNLCENHLENQQIIAQLTKVGDADNSDILKEFNIDFGSLRIGGGNGGPGAN